MLLKIITGAQVVASRSVVQEGPIFLDQLACSSSDVDLLGCRRGNDFIGLTSCDHTQDVWVECVGKMLE